VRVWLTIALVAGIVYEVGWLRHHSVSRSSDLHPRAREQLDQLFGFQPIPNYHRSSKSSSEQSELISVVSQISLDKWNRFLALTERWEGPISCALLLHKDDEERFHQLQIPDHVAIHVLLTVVTVEPQQFPINRLRNLALDNAFTPFVLYLDVDFIPVPNAFQHYQTLLRDHGWATRLEQRHELLVIPAFELFKADETNLLADIPSTKADLLVSLQRNESAPFHLRQFAPGHGPTDFTRWYNASDIYEITWQPQYEPYFITSRRDLPPFWDGLVGYGFDKDSWVTELHAMGYQFLAHYETYIIHLNHPYKNNLNEQKTRRVTTIDNKYEYFQRFGVYLKVKYHASTCILQRNFFRFVWIQPSLWNLVWMDFVQLIY
jgi:hypothetical protein